MYILLIIATILFSSQFLLNQRFAKSKGDGLDAVLTFSAYSQIISFFVMIILNRFALRITPFSLAMGLCYTLVSILYSYFGLKSLTRANLSVYSIFAMLGGMILPSAVGIVFFDESVTVAKIVCCVLIAIALALTFEKDEGKSKTYLLYLAVFILNGMSAVISKVHQSFPDMCTDSYSFVAIGNMCCFVASFLWYVLRFRSLPKVNLPQLGYTGGYAISSGVANLLTLIALTVLPASVQYPVITGGVIFFSTIVSAILGQKIGKKTIISAIIAFAATVAIIL